MTSRRAAISISAFKAKALGLLQEVATGRDELVITKRGKPIAKVVPILETLEKPVPGLLAPMVTFEKDILSPIGEEDWEVLQ